MYRELQPIVAAILHGQRLTEAQWGVLNHWSAQSVPQFRERQLGGSGEPPAVEVVRRMITRDPFVLVARQIVALYAGQRGATPSGQNIEDYAVCPICRKPYYARARRGQRSDGCSKDCSYTLKKARQREKRARLGAAHVA